MKYRDFDLIVNVIFIKELYPPENYNKKKGREIFPCPFLVLSLLKDLFDN